MRVNGPDSMFFFSKCGICRLLSFSPLKRFIPGYSCGLLAACSVLVYQSVGQTGQLNL